MMVESLTFNGFTWNDVLIEQFQYQHGGTTALTLTNEEGPIADATVNLPEAVLPDGAGFWIKDYSENTGIAQALIDAGVIVQCGDALSIGPYGVRVVPARLVVKL